MVIPELQDQLTAEQVAKRLGVSEKSVRRWMRSGLPVGGRRVRLASVKIGHGRKTCGAWVSAFLDAQNPPDPDAVSPIQTPAEVRKRDAAAKKRLAKLIGR